MLPIKASPHKHNELRSHIECSDIDIVIVKVHRASKERVSSLEHLRELCGHAFRTPCSADGSEHLVRSGIRSRDPTPPFGIVVQDPWTRAKGEWFCKLGVFTVYEQRSLHAR